MSSESVNLCPACGERGETVKAITLESLLRDDAKARVRETRYRFCDTATCETVYFPEDASAPFTKSQLTVPVGIKETTGPRHVCYCFDHTIEEIEGQVRATGDSDVLEDIKTRMAEACWCETKSPQGRCCLGLVTRVIQETKANLGSHVESERVPPLEADPPGKVIGAAALVAALAASACCWLPVGLAFVGVSGAAASTVIGRYRPFLLAATFGFLAAAFYLNLRPVSELDGDCCGPQEGSIPPAQDNSRRWLWITTFFVLALALYPTYSGSPSPGETPPQLPSGTSSWVLGVEGMTCTGCEAHVRSALGEVPGIHQVAASYDEANARIVADPSVTQQTIEEALRSIGYRLSGATSAPKTGLAPRPRRR